MSLEVLGTVSGVLAVPLQLGTLDLLQEARDPRRKHYVLFDMLVLLLMLFPSLLSASG